MSRKIAWQRSAVCGPLALVSFESGRPFCAGAVKLLSSRLNRRGKMAAPLPEKSPPAPPCLPDTSPTPDQQEGHGRSDRVPETQETDVWWGSYAGRTVLPGFLICTILTMVLLALD